ncbi:hypothetical protein G5B37_08735 [Rasiella rasia]|uniref:Uncharacterized protein n=1 Tax=Rasiella rasia TaxID=2744027 RepID=A0A6G6GM30_9FLAO|nr:hypothetical protein [Rasiella rasia]QIE59646.1 hypothetical protein G5B37_08735 [Rasiella rasia]
MLKNVSLFLLMLLSFSIHAQVGIGSVNPQAALDVSSNNNGILIPRVALTSTTDVTTVVSPNSASIVVGTLVYNTGAAGLSEAGFFHWNGARWAKLIDDSASAAIGKTIINGTGNVTINVGFTPKRITFTAYANIESYTLDTTGSSSNNKDNSFGYMKGYANNNGGSIEQQVINGGGSGESINNISRYASPNHCIGMRYANQDAVKLGLTTARVTSFTATGFVLNVDSYLASEPLVIIYEAHRY